MEQDATERDVAVVLVAAGRGERASSPSEGPKQYRKVGGKSILLRTIEALSHPRIGRIVVVIHPDDEDLFKVTAPDHPHVTAVYGGATRQESTYLGLAALQSDTPKYVLIHDAVRPFVDRDLLGRIIAALAAGNGVIPALPVSDTIKQADAAGIITSTVARHRLYGAQTPQGFSYSRILQAHELASESGRADFTDDASVAEFAGIAVQIVEGSPDNIKLTWKRDIDMANHSLTSQFPDVRVGNGYDVHAFEPGSFVTLCGVAIPFGAKLKGHSDADVGLHALTDALLATCSAGDIGTHFPPSDPQWKGAASQTFVRHAAGLVRRAGGRIANADITLICEAPKIGPHREAMVAAISAMLVIDRSRISVKATTNERLGFIGRGEGIAAIATASVVYPGQLI